MSGALAVDDDRHLYPIDAAYVSVGDRIALAASYNQMFQRAAGAADPALRDAVTGLTPGKAAVAGTIALGGIVEFLADPAHGGTPIYEAFHGIVLRAVAATGYASLDDRDAR